MNNEHTPVASSLHPCGGLLGAGLSSIGQPLFSFGAA
jgi:hypothetical protein